MGIGVKKLRKRLNGIEIYRDLNFEARRGKITAIFGPNGSGKSTLFNILAGLVKEDSGEVEIQPFDRFRFSYLFQNYREALLPWRKNKDNLTLPLEVQHVSKKRIQQRINALLKQFHVTLPLNAYPYELSGGQQQMLAFFRALITAPTTLLLDEPFSALDYENGLRQCSILQEYYLTNKPTMLIITHDIEEAVYLAEDIIVFSSKPAHVVGIVKNSIPYPRTIDTLKTETFHKVKNCVLQLFQQEITL